MQGTTQQSFRHIKLVGFVVNNALENVDDGVAEVMCAESPAREPLRTVRMHRRLLDSPQRQGRMSLLDLEVKSQRICMDAAEAPETQVCHVGCRFGAPYA